MLCMCLSRLEKSKSEARSQRVNTFTVVTYTIHRPNKERAPLQEKTPLRLKRGFKMTLQTLTFDLRTKKYPVPLARHTNLHRSLGDIPAYLGTHSTPSPEPRDTWADMSLWARHCSSRNVRPAGREGSDLLPAHFEQHLIFTPVMKLQL